jgi:hypothetical protein
MADKGKPDFGKRRQVSVPSGSQSPPAKRSNHVALLVMGTLAVGGGALCADAAGVHACRAGNDACRFVAV